MSTTSSPPKPNPAVADVPLRVYQGIAQLVADGIGFVARAPRLGGKTHASLALAPLLTKSGYGQAVDIPMGQDQGDHYRRVVAPIMARATTPRVGVFLTHHDEHWMKMHWRHEDSPAKAFFTALTPVDLVVEKREAKDLLRNGLAARFGPDFATVMLDGRGGEAILAASHYSEGGILVGCN